MSGTRPPTPAPANSRRHRHKVAKSTPKRQRPHPPSPRPARRDGRPTIGVTPDPRQTMRKSGCRARILRRRPRPRPDPRPRRPAPRRRPCSWPALVGRSRHDERRPPDTVHITHLSLHIKGPSVSASAHENARQRTGNPPRPAAMSGTLRPGVAGWRWRAAVAGLRDRRRRPWGAAGWRVRRPGASSLIQTSEPTPHQRTHALLPRPTGPDASRSTAGEWGVGAS